MGELPATNNDYEGIRAGIRTPALDTLRKYSFVLINNVEGTDKDTLEASYKKFIAVFEKLDSQCGLGVRGRKNIEVYDLYASSSQELKAFVDVAEKVSNLAPAQVPVEAVENSNTSVQVE